MPRAVNQSTSSCRGDLQIVEISPFARSSYPEYLDLSRGPPIVGLAESSYPEYLELYSSVQDLTFTSAYDVTVLKQLQSSSIVKHHLAGKTEFEFHDQVLMLVNATMAS